MGRMQKWRLTLTAMTLDCMATLGNFQRTLKRGFSSAMEMMIMKCLMSMQEYSQTTAMEYSDGSLAMSSALSIESKQEETENYQIVSLKNSI